MAWEGMLVLVPEGFLTDHTSACPRGLEQRGLEVTTLSQLAEGRAPPRAGAAAQGSVWVGKGRQVASEGINLLCATFSRACRTPILHFSCK